MRSHQRQRQAIGDDSITPATIREMIRQAKALPPTKRLPADVEETLARRLELTRDRYRIDQRAEPINAARRAAKRHMSAAREEIGKVKACLNAYLTDAKNTVVDHPQCQSVIDTSRRVLEDEIQQIDAADRLLDYLIDMTSLVERHNRTNGRWVTNAISIYDDVREALATVGSDLRIRTGGGEGEAGPGAAGRILAQLVPMLTGERTTAGSAATQLGKARRNRGNIGRAKIPR